MLAHRFMFEQRLEHPKIQIGHVNRLTVATQRTTIQVELEIRKSVNHVKAQT